MKRTALIAVIALAGCPAGCPTPGGETNDASATGGNGCIGGYHLEPDETGNEICKPTVEICDNNVDDDENDLVDCGDPACGCDAGTGMRDGGRDGGMNADGGRRREDCANGSDDDGDGLIDFDDPICQTDPLCARDSDGDGVEDCHDNAPNRYNASQTDDDHDNRGDVLDYPSAPANPTADGGVPDAALPPCAEQRFCFLVSVDFIPPAAGTDAGLLAGAVITSVPNATKICFTGDADYEQDGVRNCDDNCWGVSNPTPRCLDNSGCVNAGGRCDTDAGTCVGQDDLDHDTVGDACDAEQGTDNSAQRRVTDPDADNDGIPVPTDKCPTRENTLTQNGQDSDGDSKPDICDDCAFLQMSCQQNGNDCPDRDSDGVCDASDNCPGDFNPFRTCSAATPCMRGECVSGRCTMQDGTDRVGTVCEPTARQCEYRSLPWPHYEDDHSLANADHDWYEHRFGGECGENDGIHGSVEPGALNELALSVTSSLEGGEQTFACNAVGAIFAPPEMPSNSSCFLRFWARADRLRTMRIMVTTHNDAASVITPDFGAWDVTLGTTWQGYAPSLSDDVPTGCHASDVYCRSFRVGTVDSITVRRVEFLVGNTPGEVQLDAVELWCKPLSCPI